MRRFGVERDLATLDPLLFIAWDGDRGRWVIRRKHRTWFHNHINGDYWLSWYREDSVPILILEDGVKPGEWLLPKLYAMDSHRLPNKRGRIADAYKKIEDEQYREDEKKMSKFKDDIGELTKEAWNKISGNPVVHVKEKVF